MVQQIQPFDFGTTLRRNRLAEIASGQRDTQLQQGQQRLDQGQTRLEQQAVRDRAAIEDRQAGREQDVLNLKAQILFDSAARAENAEQFHILASQAGRGLWNEEDLEGLAQINAETFPTFKAGAPSAAERLRQGLLEDALLPDTPENRVRRDSARIQLRLSPGAVGNAAITEAGLPSDTRQTIMDDRRQSRAQTEAGRVQIEQADKALQQIPNVRRSISVIDDAIAAIDAGAESGALTRFLPSFRESTLLLEQAGRQLGLDVLSMATFGSLSEAELELALRTGLDLNQEPEALRRQLVQRRQAQEMLALELSNAARFLSNPENTLNDYIVQLARDGQFSFRDQNGSNRIDNQGGNVVTPEEAAAELRRRGIQ